MSQKMRLAVIGCGAIGKVHAKAITGLDEAQLVAVSDLRPENATKLAAEFGCNAYTDYRQMFEKEKPDLVSVCTPSGTRMDICRAAADAGVNLLVEKPLDISVERMKKILQTAEAAGIKLGCVFQLRFMPVFSSLKRAITENRFGRLIIGNAATICYRSEDYYKNGGWRGTKAQDGGGALMNQGIHNVDLLLWLMGDAKSVYAYADHLTHDIEVEDTVTAAVEFVNGAVGTIQATTSVYHGINKKLEIFGTDGAAIIMGEDPVMWKFNEPLEGDLSFLQGKESEQKGLSPTSPLIEDVSEHQQQILDMINAIREDRQPAVPGIEGQKAVELVLAIYKSAETGKKVNLPLEN
ncbi:MAG TPA: oxidoreductase [Firmicutes bacterium]|jgi:predicted dehydrogenase|nr:oxidoreductase [Bacillota bacterium]